MTVRQDEDLIATHRSACRIALHIVYYSSCSATTYVMIAVSVWYVNLSPASSAVDTVVPRSRRKTQNKTSHQATYFLLL